MENKKLISEFSKNSVEKIKIITYELNGRQLIDIRAWILQDPTDPESEIATKKRITLRVESIPDLIQALEKAQENLEFGQERPQEGQTHTE